MTALRQEAFQILEALPEERFVSVIRYMRGYEREETPSANHYLTDALTGIIPADIDLGLERKKLLKMKFESFFAARL